MTMQKFEIQARLRLIAGCNGNMDIDTVVGEESPTNRPADEGLLQWQRKRQRRAQERACEDIGDLLWSLQRDD